LAQAARGPNSHLHMTFLARVLQTLVAGVVWLCLLAVRSAATSVAEASLGNPLCRCAQDRSELPVAAESYEMHPEYGMGCGAHDKAHSPFATCTHQTNLQFCRSTWCYLPANPECELSADVSWSTIFPGLQYSYETCGSINTYRTYDLAEHLRGSTLKVVYLSNSGGWKGAYCRGGHCNGPLVRFLDTIARTNEIRMDVQHYFYTGDGYYVNDTNNPFPPQVMKAFEEAFPEEAATGKATGYSACIVATAMGYVDLCIANFLISNRRQEITHMIPMTEDAVHLVTSSSVDEPGTFDHIASAFKPFSMSLWICVLLAIIALSILIVQQDPDVEDFQGLKVWQIPFAASYIGLESAFGAASTFKPKSLPSKITQLGLGFFILLIIASYTATLTATLVVQKSVSTNINSIEDAIATGARVCADYNMPDKLGPMFEGVNWVRMDDRAASLAGIGTVCDAAAIRLQDLQAQHASGSYCNLMTVGDPLSYTTAGLPASDRVYRQINWAVSDPRVGGFERELELSRPASACSAEEPTSQSLTIENMYGAFLVAMVGITAGLLVACGKKLIS